METPRLLVLTPSRGSCSDDHADAFAQLLVECHRRGIYVRRERCTTPGLLDHARNVLLGEACEARDAPTHVWWVDADVAARPADVLELLEGDGDAAMRDGDLVVKVYPSRGTDLRALREAIDNGEATTLSEFTYAAHPYQVRPNIVDGRIVRRGELVEMVHCGFGFVMGRIEAFRALREWMREQDPKSVGRDWTGRHLVRAFDIAPHALCAHDHGCFRQYEAGREGDVAGGEDVGFYQRWCAFGRKVWCAPRGYVWNGGVSDEYARHLFEKFGERFGEGHPVNAPLPLTVHR